MLRRYHIIDLDDLRRAAAKASAHRGVCRPRDAPRGENPQENAQSRPAWAGVS